MSIYPENIHQPPNPADLERVAPTTPDCARVRGMLRDHADRDLSVAQAALVDEHVHGCRVCAIELARAEHEVLRLQQAFQGVRQSLSASQTAVRSDFASRVVEQLVLTDSVDSVRSGSADVDAADLASEGAGPSEWSGRSEGFRGGSLAGRVTGGRKAATSARMRAVTPMALLLAGASALLVLVLGARFFGDDFFGEHGVQPDSAARLVVVSASGSFDGLQRPLDRGDFLEEAQSLWVRRGGSARVEWNDQSQGAQPAATIEVQGGQLSLTNGSPRLSEGQLLIQTNRPVDIPMSDDSIVSLGRGEYVIAAEIPLELLDEARAFAEENGGAVLPGSLKINVEVREGQEVQVLRGGIANLVIQAGQRVAYQGSGAGSASQGMGPVAASGRTERDVQSPPRVETLTAQIFGYAQQANGAPSVNTQVFVSYVSGGQIIHNGEITGSEGSFLMELEQPCESDFAVVLGLPPLHAEGYGISAPQALPLVRTGDYVRLARALQIVPSAPVRGSVRSDAGELVAGVEVMPCLVDELFDSVLALHDHQTVTDAFGNFEIPRLPGKLAHHQHLVVMVSSDDLEPTVVAVPPRNGSSLILAPIDLVARSLKPTDLHAVPPNESLIIYEEVPGLPLGSAAVIRSCSSDANGMVSGVRLGSGAKWLRSGGPGSPRVRALHHHEVSESFQPVAGSVPLSQNFRALHSIGGGEIMLAQSYRYEGFEARKIENAATSNVLRVFDSFNHPIEYCEVFAVRQSAMQGRPTPRFLGFTSDQGAIATANLDPGEGLLVIAPDGSLAWVDDSQTGSLFLNVHPVQSGSVWVAPSLRPSGTNAMLAIRLRRQEGELLDGMAPEVVRFASPGSGWNIRDVPAGTYDVEVEGEDLTITVPATYFATLGV